MKKVNYIVNLRNSLKEEKRHMPILQDGAAAIIINEKNEILLEHRTDRDIWCLPGGCQELGETFKETIIREVKEETNLDIKEKDLQLIDIISGKSRYNIYPNGDEVYNNTVLYLITKYNGNIKCDSESKEAIFVKLNKLPSNLMDKDLIQSYIKLRNIK